MRRAVVSSVDSCLFHWPAGLVRKVALSMIAIIAVAGAPIHSAMSKDPALPAGLDPGGTAIALISEGVDYTDPEIANRLARDGEGLLIGWDFIDNDPYPYPTAPSVLDNGPSGTELAKSLLKVYRNGRLVPLRIDITDPTSIAKAAAFVARTPARIVAVPQSSQDAKAWEAFRKVAEQTPGTVYVVSAGKGAVDGTAEVWPASFRLPNAISIGAFSDTTAAVTLVPTKTPIDAWMVRRGASMFEGITGGVAAAMTGAEAVATAAGQIACAQHGKEQVPASDARSLFLMLGRPHKLANRVMVHDPMCWYGGTRY